GRAEEAKAAFRAALAEDPACEEAAEAIAQAEAGPGGIEEELRDRITALVFKLGGAEREQATNDLRQIGARSVPFLEEGLRTADVGIVTGCACILADLPATGARAGLARALADPKVAFPDIVRRATGNIPVTGKEVDRPGRYALLREALRLEEPARGMVLQAVLRMGIQKEPAAEVGPLLLALLREADDTSRAVLLNANPGEASAAILPAAAGYLSSADPAVRAAALTACGYAKKQTPESIAALRRVLDAGEPVERSRAFLLLVREDTLAREERIALVNRFLAEGEPDVLKWVLDWVGGDVGRGLPGHWDPGYAPGLLAGMRRALEAGAEAPERVAVFVRAMHEGLRDLGEEDLLDLARRCSALGSKETNGILDTTLRQVFSRHQAEKDPGMLGRVFLLGLDRLRGQALHSWVTLWGSRHALLPGSALVAFGEIREDVYLRSFAWSWLLARETQTWPPFTPALHASLGEDLLHETNAHLAGQAQQVARFRPDPSLSAPVRALLARTQAKAPKEQTLHLLIACAGREARDDVAAFVREFDDLPMLRILVNLVGKEAIPEIRAFLAAHPESDSALDLLIQVAGRDAAPEIRARLEVKENNGLLDQLFGLLGGEALPDARRYLGRYGNSLARNLVVRMAGVDAVPDLLAACLARPQSSEWWILGPRWSNPPEPGDLGVPPEVAVAYFEACPEERRTPRLLQQVSFVLPAEKRNAYVNGYLSDPRPDMAAAAAWVVRRFNMVEYWPRLLPLLDNADEKVRIEAREALDSIRKYRELKESFERYGMEGSKKALDDAAALAKDPDP
ncbi:MAG: hypothetical protein HUU06_09985, partial [Planctomycetaceae bacterium]|nr:hypothetical protein [Planctomycetaceae bacterium]